MNLSNFIKRKTIEISCEFNSLFFFLTTCIEQNLSEMFIIYIDIKQKCPKSQEYGKFINCVVKSMCC